MKPGKKREELYQLWVADRGGKNRGILLSERGTRKRASRLGGKKESLAFSSLTNGEGGAGRRRSPTIRPLGGGVREGGGGAFSVPLCRINRKGGEGKRKTVLNPYHQLPKTRGDEEPSRKKYRDHRYSSDTSAQGEKGKEGENSLSSYRNKGAGEKGNPPPPPRSRGRERKGNDPMPTHSINI